MTRTITILLLLLLALPTLAYPDGNERAVILKGTRNTRDLGGLPITGGSFPEGKVIRSGALCFATLDDAAKLHGMGLQTIIDLRLQPEIDKDGPDKPYLTEKVPNNLHWPMANSQGLGQEAYHYYMLENESLFRDFFELLAKEENLPVLFHCSAGKDRTGIFAALLLESLGTSREVIMDDYIHSRRITHKLKVEEDWLNEVFLAVDAAGGIDDYLLKIGVTDEVRRAVEKNLGAVEL